MNSNDYLLGALQAVREIFPNLLDSQILNSLLPSLLLALVARDTNLIISTPQPAELQKSISKILTIIFGLQTKRLKIRSPQSPHQFLASLPISSLSGSSSHRQKLSRGSLSRSISAPRPSSSHVTEGSDSTAPPSSRFPRHKTDPLPHYADYHVSHHLPQVLVISGLERAGRAAQLALAELLRSRKLVLEEVTWELPENFFVVYVSPVGDGYERPPIHLTLLDHFAFSMTLPHNSTSIPTSSPNSPRLKKNSLSNTTPKKPPLLFTQLPYVGSIQSSPPISHYTTALLTAARHHPELDGTFLTVRCVKDAEKLVCASGLVFRSNDGATVLETHVRRVLPPILAHRLRVRESPREQIMGLLWEGAGVLRSEYPETRPARKTIKAILAEIIGEV